jgi:hypothetical protein
MLQNIALIIVQPLYCERHNVNFFDEPLNAFSNLAFILASVYSISRLQRMGVKSRVLKWLTGVPILIALGSLAYHIVPGPVTLAADTLPIYLFILTALCYLLYKISSSWLVTGFTISVYVALLIGATILTPASFAGGSIRHLITASLALVLIIMVRRRTKSTPFKLILALMGFIAAIFFRSIDLSACAFMPLGTHFLWHILAGATSYVLLSFLIDIQLTVEPAPAKEATRESG